MDTKRRPKPYPRPEHDPTYPYPEGCDTEAQRASWDRYVDDWKFAGQGIALMERLVNSLSDDPYIEAANANPERVNNGCQIYKRGQS